MSGTEYKPPTLNENTFNCGHCGAFALQIWGDMFIQARRPRCPVGLACGEMHKLHGVIDLARRQDALPEIEPRAIAESGSACRNCR
jgi:hypothetical protein